MALQGDLQSFALPDVLRLLAGTAKSGRLQVDGPVGGGELVFHSGTIASGAVPQAPHATTPGDVVFEILRFDGGAFRFTDAEVDEDTDADGTPVEDAIAHAEHLVTEWAEVETVVPGMGAWIEMAPEITDDSVEVSASAWKALAFIGGGTRVSDLGVATDQSDLDACRQVKAMVEQGLLAVRPDHVEVVSDTYRGPVVELDSFEQFETELAHPVTDLAGLGSDDRPVVLEEREDALLPEPLPGEGVAFEGELLEGTVDGHGFDTTEDEPEGATTLEDEDEVEAEMDLEVEVEAEADDDLVAAEELVADEDGSPEPAAEAVHDQSAAEVEVDSSTDEEPVADAADAVPFVEDLAGAVDPVDEILPELDPADIDEAEVDDERGSLLRFLSTVKP